MKLIDLKNLTDEQKQGIKEALNDALKRLGKNGEHWIKGSYRAGRGNACLSEAVVPFSPAWQFLCKQIGVQILSSWNDDQLSFTPVKAELEKAIKALES